ncbi:MAG: bifunctional aspartate kinase/homoserine dehydrogenase I, partial [Deltaproteobacteria bacterium]|nr:bifunctional aspartate kinase/homoserine dehydrogenase I [Deltaproteobacteria bacterium]
MPLQVVMKFGGTSLADAAAMGSAADRVIADGRPALVVVSAVGGVTDLLLRAAALAQQKQDFGPVLREIRARHDGIVDAETLSPRLVTELHEELGRLLTGISMLRELSTRTEDVLVSL